MKQSSHKKQANILTGEIIVIIALFIFFSYIAQVYKADLQETIGQSNLGMIIYVLIFMIAVIVAPINSEPLIPIASSIWGWFIAGVLTLIGWTIGSLIAFMLARRYGLPLIKKFISLKKIEELEKMIPQNHLFASVVFLRMTVQVDVLSYLLGFLTTMKPRTYFLASLIGLAPLAFILAYLGEQPLLYQLLALSTGLLIILLGILLEKKRERRTNRVKN